MVFHQAWRVLGSLGRHPSQWLGVIASRASVALRRASQRIALTRAARMIAAALLGMAYGPMTAAVIGVMTALAVGIAKTRPDISQLGTHLLLAGFIVAPVIGLTLGYLALGIGGLVATACAAMDGGVGAGLEWAIVAGLGAALGIALTSAPPQMVALGLAFGGIIGGSVGFVTWLTCTSRQRQMLSLKAAAAYAAGLVLIAGYVLLIAGQIIAVPGA